jgi:hypothetical protein
MMMVVVAVAKHTNNDKSQEGRHGKIISLVLTD